MDPKFIIREITEADILAAAKLLRQMWLQHAHATRLLDTAYIENYDVESYIRKILGNPKQKAFVAEIDRQVVGFSQLDIEDNLPGMYGVDRMAYFDSLVVDEKYRRQGIADKLVEHRLRWAKDQGIKVCYSKIYSFNKAPQALMRKHGFEDIYHFYYKFLD